jgi:hypothetical protein
MKPALGAYGLDEADTDQLGYDFAAALADNIGISLVLVAWNALNKVQAFEALRRRFATEGIGLPPDPAVRADLIAVRKRLTPTGVSIHLPTTGDGRHCDYAPPLARLAAKFTDEHAPPPGATHEEPTWEQKEIEARERQQRDRAARREEAWR